MNGVHLFAKFAGERIDKAKRMVWGIAQIEDGPDTQGDVVDFDASLRAFNDWPGNVREMHTAKAVGRRVQVIPLKDRKAILVGVRISDGAEDTWKKVLDGTLTGFSIGGYATDKKKIYDTALGKYVNRIDGYVLTELSLVDAPANPKCKFTVVEKRNNILVASDVLGDIPRGGINVAGTRTPSKAALDLKKFAEGAAESDEFLVVKKSDLGAEKRGSGEVIVLKSNAAMLQLKKGDFDGDGFDEGGAGEGGEGGEGGGVADGIDLDGHAKNAYDLHDALHKMAGSECKCAGGNDAVGGDQGIAGLDKSLSAKGLTELINKAVGDRLGTMESKLDAMTAQGGTIAPRRGSDNGAGAPVNKDVTGGESTTLTAGNSVEQLQKAVNSLASEAKQLIAKRDSRQELSSAERLRLEELPDEVARAKTALLEAQRGAVR